MQSTECKMEFREPNVDQMQWHDCVTDCFDNEFIIVHMYLPSAHLRVCRVCIHLLFHVLRVLRLQLKFPIKNLSHFAHKFHSVEDNKFIEMQMETICAHSTDPATWLWIVLNRIRRE